MSEQGWASGREPVLIFFKCCGAHLNFSVVHDILRILPAEGLGVGLFVGCEVTVGAADMVGAIDSVGRSVGPTVKEL